MAEEDRVLLVVDAARTRQTIVEELRRLTGCFGECDIILEMILVVHACQRLGHESGVRRCWRGERGHARDVLMTENQWQRSWITMASLLWVPRGI